MEQLRGSGTRKGQREKASAAKQVLRAGLEALAGAGTVLEGMIRNREPAFRARGWREGPCSAEGAGVLEKSRDLISFAKG